MAREMKDSGFVWLGQIPHDWEIRKLKHYYTLKTGFTPDTKKQEYYDETGYDWVNISDLSDGATIYETRKKISQAYVDAFSPEQIPAGSLMYSFKLSVGQTSFAGKPLFTNEAIASFLASETVDLHYLRYSSSFIIENAQTNIYNAKILNQDLINNAYVPFPPLAEQARIAAFLDRKCAEIDSVIADTQRTIEEYKKLKQSVITQAVTKGIRGERPMKDSEIEWVGQIPSEWDVVRIKTLFDYRNERNNKPLEEVNLISLYTDKGVVQHCDLEETTGNKASNADGYKLVYQDDIVVNIILCWMGAIGRSSYSGVTSPAYDVYSPKPKTNSEFYHYYFRTSGFSGDCYKYGRGIMAMRWRTYSDEFRALQVVCPSVEEQDEIVAYLDEKCDAIDRIIAAKQQLIAEMEVYKKSVIYEYVTGKKEVPACQ